MDLEKEIRKFEAKINVSNYTDALHLIDKLKDEIIETFDDDIYYHVEEYGSEHSILIYMSKVKPNCLDQNVWKDLLVYLDTMFHKGKRTAVLEDPEILYASSRGLIEDPSELKVTLSNEGEIGIEGSGYHANEYCADEISSILHKLNELMEEENPEY